MIDRSCTERSERSEAKTPSAPDTAPTGRRVKGPFEGKDVKERPRAGKVQKHQDPLVFAK